MIRSFATSTTESNYEQIITLDGEDFILRFLWNERDSHWYMTLRDSAGADIITGIKIVEGTYAWYCVTEGMPVGKLFFVEGTGSGDDPGLRDLGTRSRLVYIDEASFA